jgi:2-keto-3-deoxy-6-phosphogluconate aldolase
MRAGVCGVGMGSELYAPGDSAADVYEKASSTVEEISKIMRIQL